MYLYLSPFNALYMCAHTSLPQPYGALLFLFCSTFLISDSSRIIITSNLIQYHVVNGKKHDYDDNKREMVL